VAIDTSGGGNDPESIIAKMDAVIRAATAPAEPSSQDRQVAAQARQARTEAVVEARQEANEVEESGAVEEEDENAQNGGLHKQILRAITAYQEPLQRSAQTDLFV